MTTHILVSSAWIPVPLPRLELPRVLAAGLMKSPCGDRVSSGLYWSGFSIGPFGTVGYDPSLVDSTFGGSSAGVLMVVRSEVAIKMTLLRREVLVSMLLRPLIAIPS